MARTLIFRPRPPPSPQSSFSAYSTAPRWFFSPHRRLPLNARIDGVRYTWGHRVENNRYGFRERDFASPKPSGVYRIMVLGDSFTWGAGLAVEERYTAIAEALLNEASHRSRFEFEVLNFGLRAAPTTDERDVLRDYKDLVNPDLIVVGFCINDPQSKETNYSIERETLDTSSAGLAVRAVRDFGRDAGLRYLSDLLWDAFHSAAERAGLIPDWQDALQRTYEPSSDEWRSFVQALVDVKGMSDEMRLPPPIFSVLNHGRYSSDYVQGAGYVERYLAWSHQAEQAAREAGFVAYNHEDEILRLIGHEPMYLNVLDDHPAANLNRVYGEKLFRTIRSTVRSADGARGVVTRWERSRGGWSPLPPAARRQPAVAAAHTGDG